jgi:hypothetical protein
MTFHFQCPYGHLLAGEESQAGQQCMCPVCTALFIIPAPLTPAFPAVSPFPEPEPTPGAGRAAAPSPFPAFDPYDRRPSKTRPAITPEPEPPASPPPTPPASAPLVVVPTESEVLHIPCPQGHMLETPAEMLDQEVLCPHCQVKFYLRRKDSEEYKQKKRAERVRKEQRKGQAWIIWAVVVVIAVLLGLGYLIIHSSGD